MLPYQIGYIIKFGGKNARRAHELLFGLKRQLAVGLPAVQRTRGFFA
jgi:hypothetical protein